jgi:hypothetical protein
MDFPLGDAVGFRGARRALPIISWRIKRVPRQNERKPGAHPIRDWSLAEGRGGLQGL